MEDWQKEHINRNLVMLCKNTACKIPFLTALKAENVISEDEINQLLQDHPGPTKLKKAKQLYNILVTRTDSYKVLIEVLEKTKQSDAVEILRNHEEKYQHFENITCNENHVLGRGSYGTTVYGGKFGRRDVAVKVKNTEFIDADLAENEIKMLLKLDFHRNIVQYFMAEMIDNCILVVLERCAITLQDEVQMNLIKMDNVSILRKCTEGLDHLHRHGVIHCDLQPSNILLTENKEVKISGFGLSKEISAGDSSVIMGDGMGATDWVAPEVLKCLNSEDESLHQVKLSVQTDVFSLGCVYYFTISKGVHPFGVGFHITSNICDDKPNLDSAHMREVWRPLIKKLISHDPSKRPSTSEVLSHHLFRASNKVPKVKNISFGEDSSSQSVGQIVSTFRDAEFEFQKSINAAEAHNWQKFTLRWNAVELRQCVNKIEVWKSLRRDGVLSKFWQSKLKTYFNWWSLHPFSKGNFYDNIISSLEKTHQYKALAILKKGYKTCDKWKNENALLFNAEFDSLAEAIGYNCDVSCLKKCQHLLFQTNELNANENLLHVAAGCGHLDAIQYLVSIGLDVSSLDKNGNTPMHYVGRFGGNAVVVTDMLLKQGADPSQRNYNGNTVAHLICNYVTSREYQAWMEYIVNRGLKSLLAERDGCNRAFLLAIKKVEFTEATINFFSSKLKVKMNCSLKRDMTLPMLAARNGQCIDVINRIIKLGGEWRRPDKDGLSVLHHAVLGGNLEAVRYFVFLGADINAKTNFGLTAFHCLGLSWYNHDEITKLLLKHEGDLFAKTNAGDTVAHLFWRHDVSGRYANWKEMIEQLGHAELFNERNEKGYLPHEGKAHSSADFQN